LCCVVTTFYQKGMFFCAFFNIFIKVNLCISRGKINFYTPKVEKINISPI
jgi:hypothetical protein